MKPKIKLKKSKKAFSTTIDMTKESPKNALIIKDNESREELIVFKDGIPIRNITHEKKD